MYTIVVPSLKLKKVVKSTRTAAASLHTTDDPTSVHNNTRSYLRSKQLEIAKGTSKMAAVKLIFISAVFGLFKLNFDGKWH
jgi:hypothetical protein